MAKSKKYVLKRKGGSSKKKHVRFNLNHSKKSSRKKLRRSSTLGIALKAKRSRTSRRSSRRTRVRTVARGKSKTRSRLGGFRGGYGPGGGPVGAPWDGAAENVSGYPTANHYAYNRDGIGIGGLDPGLSTRTIGENQNGGGLMDMIGKMIPQGLVTGGEMLKYGATSVSSSVMAGDNTTPTHPLPTNQKIDNDSRIVYPEKPTNLGGFATEAAAEASSV